MGMCGNSRLRQPAAKVHRVVGWWKVRAPFCMNAGRILVLLAVMISPLCARALERTNVVFKIFQFPADKIPRIDGQTNDWDMVPADYAIGMNEFVDDTGQHSAPDPKTLNVSVK